MFNIKSIFETEFFGVSQSLFGISQSQYCGFNSFSFGSAYGNMHSVVLNRHSRQGTGIGRKEVRLCYIGATGFQFHTFPYMP